MEILRYVLTADDVTAINRRRVDPATLTRYDSTIGEDVPNLPGYVVHVGSEVSEGDIVPLIVTKVNDDNTVNGQAILDGNDSLWVVGVLALSND